MEKVMLAPLEAEDHEQFIRDNQWAFKHGAMMEFGVRDDHLDGDGEIISRKTIENSIDAENSETYLILLDGRKVGGVGLMLDKETNHNCFDLFFIHPDEHSKGLGYSAWCAVEALHPETKVWETCTPYFEKRSIHFYVNKCGFQIVEFYNRFNPDPNLPKEKCEGSGPDEMFRLPKITN